MDGTPGSLARTSARRAKSLLARLDPIGHLPGAGTRYRDSWRSEDVARQMLELTNSQLGDPDVVPPYRAFRQVLAPVVDAPSLPRPATLLDIGAGMGAYGELVDRWWPGRFAYVGADSSEPILALARRRWPDRTFVHADLFDPGALNGYDVVMASAVIDVLADVDGALDALLRADARWVVLHRQRIGGKHPSVRVARGYRGQRTYSSFATVAQLQAAARRNGRTIVSDVGVDGDVRSFVFAQRAD
jgi:hypothetical protein